MAQKSKSLFLHVLTAGGGALCALVITGVLKAGALPVSQPVPPAGYVAERNSHTAVYAPSAAAAREGQQDVEYARTRFHALFGIDAPTLVVVLADDPAQFRGMDLASLQSRGERVLPFLTRANLAASPMHVEVAAGLRAEGEEPVRLLAHEACHAYVVALTKSTARRGSKLGDAALPAWLEESIATLCESPEARAARRRYFRDHLDQYIPLAVFERLSHPLGDTKNLKELGIQTTPGHAAVHVVTAERVQNALPEARPALFYAQALSLGEFIATRADAREMRILARLLANGRTLDQALNAVHRTAPRLPATVSALELEWLSWVREDDRR